MLARRAAFGLLRALMRRCPLNTAAVLQLMDAQALQLYDDDDDSRHLRPLSSWSSNSGTAKAAASAPRAASGYVGLTNLGCICYMNSLLQQLYMI